MSLQGKQRREPRGQDLVPFTKSCACLTERARRRVEDLRTDGRLFSVYLGRGDSAISRSSISPRVRGGYLRLCMQRVLWDNAV